MTKIRSSRISLAVRMAYRLGLVAGALALEVEKEAHGKLPEAVRGLYKEGEGGKFRLDVDGVEDIAGLKSALEKERERGKKADKYEKDAGALREQLKAFEGIDPAKYKEIMEKAGSEEEQKLFKDGKLDEVVSRRMDKVRLDFEKKLAKAAEERQGALEVASTFMDRVLENHIRAAAAKAGVHATAVDDAILRARGVFQLDDDGNPVQLDGEGDDAKPVLGKDGKTPFSPSEWFDGMKEAAPHWFPAGSSGGGSQGAGGKGGGGAKTVKRAVFDALGDVEKMTKIKEGFKVVD